MLVYLKFPDLALEIPDTHYDELWSTHTTYFWGAHGVVLGGIIALTILSGWAQRSGYQVMHGNKLLFEDCPCTKKEDTESKADAAKTTTNLMEWAKSSKGDAHHEKSIRQFAGQATDGDSAVSGDDAHDYNHPMNQPWNQPPKKGGVSGGAESPLAA